MGTWEAQLKVREAALSHAETHIGLVNFRTKHDPQICLGFGRQPELPLLAPAL